MIAVVVIANLWIVQNFACKIIIHKLHDITLASLNYLNTTAAEFINSSLTYIAGKHQRDAHLLHFVGNVRLASTAFGAGKCGGRNNLLVIILIHLPKDHEGCSTRKRQRLSRPASRRTLLREFRLPADSLLGIQL